MFIEVDTPITAVYNAILDNDNAIITIFLIIRFLIHDIYNTREKNQKYTHDSRDCMYILLYYLYRLEEDSGIEYNYCFYTLYDYIIIFLLNFIQHIFSINHNNLAFLINEPMQFYMLVCICDP